jgi:hypothetical protein
MKSKTTGEHGNGRMKGQFFLIGAFLLLTLFYLGISAYMTPSYSHPVMKGETENLFTNILDEYPAALNLGLNSTGGAAALADFSLVAINATRSRGASLKALWILTENASDDLNVTVGNFLGAAVNVTLNVSGSMSSFEVADKATKSVTFVLPPSEFQLRASFNTTEKNLLLEKYKANLYVILEMRKGNDRIAGETTA